jgi:sirohydrochlorin cobaltochelatase
MSVPDGDLAIVLLFHGSRAEEAWAFEQALARSAAHAAGARDGHAAHLSGVHTLLRAVRACVATGATDIRVVPMFVSPGAHATKDVPELVRAAASDVPSGVNVRATTFLGAHPALARLAVDLALGREDERER